MFFTVNDGVFKLIIVFLNVFNVKILILTYKYYNKDESNKHKEQELG